MRAVIVVASEGSEIGAFNKAVLWIDGIDKDLVEKILINEHKKIYIDIEYTENIKHLGFYLSFSGYFSGNFNNTRTIVHETIKHFTEADIEMMLKMHDIYANENHKRGEALNVEFMRNNYKRYLAEAYVKDIVE